MTAECRPPPGTPDGTWCWLKRPGVPGWLCLMWAGRLWHEVRAKHDPKTVALWNYRFHSIATPPEGEG